MITIKADRIGKVFRIYNRPVDRLLEVVTGRPRHTTFTALKDISFRLDRGDTLGIVGSNGAGKSTLLKVLAGTLSPSSGALDIRGRVMALLELGSGFNPEFTGRENIFLNASLLGLSSGEIREKEDEIIEFSGISDFIDRPVKTYSSGMYVRLAFAIATSVDPDILVIDEALSVGDDAFQRKCIRRMEQFRRSGKILLFCSHSLYQVNILCERAIWIKQGRIHMVGNTAEVTRAYEDWAREIGTSYDEAGQISSDTAPTVACRTLRVGLYDAAYTPLEQCRFGDSVRFVMEVEAVETVIVHFGFAVFRNDGLLCFCAMGNFEGQELLELTAGQHVQVELAVPQFNLMAGEYRLLGGVVDSSGMYILHQLYSEPFTVVSDNFTLGVTTFPHEWKICRQG